MTEITCPQCRCKIMMMDYSPLCRICYHYIGIGGESYVKIYPTAEDPELMPGYVHLSCFKNNIEKVGWR